MPDPIPNERDQIPASTDGCVRLRFALKCVEEAERRAEIAERKAAAAEELAEACRAVVAFRFSFDKRNQDNGAYRDEVRGLQRSAKAALHRYQEAGR